MSKIGRHDIFGDKREEKKPGKLCGTFVLPPFTILDARQGWWKRRTRMWLALGIQSEVGRDVIPGGGGPNSAMHRSTGKYGETKQAKTYNSGSPGDLSRQLKAKGKQRLAPGGGGGGCWLGGRHTSTAEKYNVTTPEGSGTSIYSPVLCELAYRWLLPRGGQVIDPFAGGSVRGIVASCLGCAYWGADLRDVQVAANQKQAELICPSNMPTWVCGDSNVLLRDAPEADLIHTCPPYGDLEVYSGDPSDLSAMSREAFSEAYQSIIRKAAEKLRDNRFAIITVGNYRDPRNGYLRDLVSETTRAFKRAGMRLWNDAILVTAVGSLPIRTVKQFKTSRKLGRTHQYVLIYVKGCGRKATEACGEVYTGW